MAGGAVGKMVGGSQIALEIMLAEIVAFLIPTFLLIAPLRKGEPVGVPLGIGNARPRAFGFAALLALSCFFLSFFINFAVLQLTGMAPSQMTPTAVQASGITREPLLYFFAVAFVPGIVEEIFVRGPVQQVFSRFASTGTVIFLSGLVFAMLHGSLQNFIGPLLCGVCYAWLTFTYKSIWPAIWAHIINNVLYLCVLWLTDTYSAYGIWNYVPPICVILFLLFGYLTFRMAEDMLLDGQIPHFQRGQSLGAAIRSIFGNPASVAFVAAFLVKTVFDFI